MKILSRLFNRTSAASLQRLAETQESIHEKGRQADAIIERLQARGLAERLSPEQLRAFWYGDRNPREELAQAALATLGAGDLAAVRALGELRKARITFGRPSDNAGAKPDAEVTRGKRVLGNIAAFIRHATFR